MRKIDDSIKGIEVDFELTDRERATVASAVNQEWFDIIQKLMESEIRKFNLRLMNTSVTKKEDVLANHIAAKVIAQWYAGFMERINAECEKVALDIRNAVAEPVNEMQLDELR